MRVIKKGSEIWYSKMSAGYPLLVMRNPVDWYVVENTIHHTISHEGISRWYTTWRGEQWYYETRSENICTK